MGSNSDVIAGAVAKFIWRMWHRYTGAEAADERYASCLRRVSEPYDVEVIDQSK